MVMMIIREEADVFFGEWRLITHTRDNKNYKDYIKIISL